jgi:predicted nucleic acid-binding protein
MKYVLDSSVALKWVLPEPDTAKAVRLRDGYRNAVHELLAPDFFPVEAAHALARAERRKIISPPQGGLHLADILKTLPLLHTSVALLPRAFSIASTARIGAYDCVYVALAEREGCEFVTADHKLIKNLQKQYPFITALASLP